MRILIVEDELHLAEALVQILRKNRYTVDAVHDGKAGLENALTGIYDVIVLDIMLPRMDGISVLKQLRKERIATPVILLTAKADVADKVAGLDSGADDYLAKPFATDELLARIRAASRRRGEVPAGGHVEVRRHRARPGHPPAVVGPPAGAAHHEGEGAARAAHRAQEHRHAEGDDHREALGIRFRGRRQPRQGVRLLSKEEARLPQIRREHPDGPGRGLPAGGEALMFRKLRNSFLVLNLVATSVMMLAAFGAIYLVTWSYVQRDTDRDLAPTPAVGRRPDGSPDQQRTPPDARIGWS